MGCLTSLTPVSIKNVTIDGETGLDRRLTARELAMQPASGELPGAAGEPAGGGVVVEAALRNEACFPICKAPVDPSQPLQAFLPFEAMVNSTVIRCPHSAAGSRKTTGTIPQEPAPSRESAAGRGGATGNIPQEPGRGGAGGSIPEEPSASREEVSPARSLGSDHAARVAAETDNDDGSDGDASPRGGASPRAESHMGGGGAAELGEESPFDSVHVGAPSTLNEA